MRVVSSAIRVLSLVLTAIFVIASSKSTTRGPSKTVVYYEPRPELQWQPRAGVTYRVVLRTVPRGGGERAQVLADVHNHTERRWRPDFDLDFGSAYDFYVYDQSSRSTILSLRFTVGFQKPQVLFPAENAKVNNLSPRFEWAPAAYSQVWYDVTIAESQAMDAPLVTSHLIPQQGNERVQAGRDGEFGTADDVKFIRWITDGVLQANKSYFWRVQAFYFGRDEVRAGLTPERDNAIGRAETIGRFTIPPQSGASDALANVTRITTDQANTVQPTMSKNGEMAYVQIDPDGGSEIRVAVAKARDGRPVFDPGREAFTKKVERSWDLSPQWDVDGEGMYFASNRSQDTFNIWYKRRDTRGYTQLTFHDSDALFPSVARDGNKIVYQLGDWDPSSNNCVSQCSIWVIDRDGKAATELGNGEKPVLSPDAKRIAYVDRGDIWVMDLTGSNKIQLTNDHADNDFPVWHPSGQRLVFMSERSGNMDLWDVEIDGARMTQLTNYLGADITPEFTPDGRHLLFASTRGGKWRSIWMGEMGR